MTHSRWILALVTSALLTLAGCSGDSNQGEGTLGQVKQALTSDQERILGLDDASDYVATPTGVATLSTVAPLTQGSGAVRLAHPDQGWSSVCSAPMADLGEVTSGTVSLDYRLEQDTPWYGILHLVLSFSTGGYEWVDLGEVNIQGQTPGVVHTASWSLAPAATPLSQSYSSVKVCLLLGGIAGGYVFDDVDFGFPAGTTGTGGVTGTGGSDSTTDGTTGTGGDTTTDTTTTDASGGTGGTDSSGGTGGTDSSGGTGGTTSSDTGGSGGTGGSSGSGGTGGSGGTAGQCEPSTSDWDHLEIQIADRLDWKKVAVGSQGGHLELHDRVQVVDANGKFAPVSATGTPGDTFRTEIGAYAHVGDVASGNRVEQRVWSIVEGHIKTSKTYLPQQPETLTVTGGVYTNAPVEPYAIHEVPYQFPAGYAQEPSTIQNGVSYSLSPGAYGHVRVQANSRLELTGAEGGAYYYFNGGLNIESGNTLAIDNAQGPVFIFIDGEYTQRSPIEYTAPGQYNVLIGVLGANTISLDGPQQMILVAPEADITLPSVNDPQRHRGGFYGKTIIVHQDSVIEGHPFARNDCATADDGLGSAFGCEPADSDGDGISDCEEVASGTDPGGFNGLTATWYGVYGDLPDLTTFVDYADLRSYLDSLDVIDSVRTTGGWNLTGSVGGNPCSYDSGIEPRFAACDSVVDLPYDHWIVTLSGTLKTQVLGQTCWQGTAGERLADGTTNDLPPGLVHERVDAFVDRQRISIFDAVGDGENEGASCLDCGSQFCPIDIVISVTDTIRDIGVNWCRDNLQQCIDSWPIGRPPSPPVEPQCDENECDERCPCGRGEGQCEVDEEGDCAEGLECGVDNGGHFNLPLDFNACWDPSCAEDVFDAGCGTTSSPCGSCVSVPPTCTGDADCPINQACGINNGLHFGLSPAVNVCWPASPCANDLSLACGEISSACGVCICSATCEGKTCGDNVSNECGGICPVCGPLEECQLDAECSDGLICAENGLCTPESCAVHSYLLANCGDDAECGPCPDCEAQCDGRECGVDPDCGVMCGSCGGELACVGGRCVDSPPVPPNDATSEVGAVAGSFAVTESGAATYRIPLAAPPGRGLTPDLSLAYTSTKRDGFLGLGWQLQGLGQITRCPESYAQSHENPQDGPNPIRLDEQDRFCLGDEMLIAVNGEYGEDGTEYRTERDTFSKIVSYGPQFVNQEYQGPSSFVVYLKNGEIREYGSAALAGGTDLAASVYVSPNWKRIKRAWALGAIADRSGNAMRVHYSTQRQFIDSETEDLVPSAISYSPGDREVRFLYDPRPGDQDFNTAGLRNQYTLGQRIRHERRLREVQMVVGDQVVRSYRIGYHGRTDGGLREPLLLKDVRECVPDGGETKCKRPTVFEYNQPQGFDVHPAGVVFDFDFGSPEDQPVVLDANGDGRDDVNRGNWIAMATGDRENPFTVVNATLPQGTDRRELPNLILDYNNDGRDDFVVETDSGFRVYTLNSSQQYDVLAEFDGFSVRPTKTVDLDGDGVKDVFGCTGQQEFIFLSTPGGAADFYSQVVGGGDCNGLAIDVDGDGAPNLLSRASGAWQYLDFAGLSGNSQWLPLNLEPYDDLTLGELYDATFEGTQPPPEQHLSLRVGNFNGDGLADFLELTGQGNVQVWANTGAGFWLQGSPDPSTDAGIYPSQWAYSAVLDYDGDGRDDLIRPTNDLSLKLHQGLDWTLNKRDDVEVGPGWWWRAIIGDFDGDGDRDVLGGNSTATQQADHSVWFGSGKTSYLLNKVTDGLGVVHTVEYATTRSNGERVYEPDPGACSGTDTLCAKTAPALVSTHRVKELANGGDENSLGTSRRRFEYTYTDLRRGLFGRGSYGFGEVEVKEYTDSFFAETLWQTVTTRYNNDSFELAGTASSREVRTATLPETRTTKQRYRLTRTEYNWVVAESDAGRPFPFIETSEEKVSDYTPEVSGGTLFLRNEILRTTTQQQVDEFGNITFRSVQVINPNGPVGEAVVTQSLVGTEYEHEADPSRIDDWLIALPSRRLVSEGHGAAIPEARETQFEYDDLGRLEKTTRVGEDTEYRALSLARGAFGQVEAVTSEDAFGDAREETIQWDARALFPVAMTNAAGETSFVEMHEVHGVPIRTVDPNGLEVVKTYDGFGRLTGVNSWDGAAILEYSDPNVDAELPPDPVGSYPDDYAKFRITTYVQGGTTSFVEQDAFGRTVRVHEIGLLDTPVTSATEYDSFGNVLAQSRPHEEGDTSQGLIEHSYDAWHNRIATIFPDDTAVEFYYANRDTYVGTGAGFPATNQLFAHYAGVFASFSTKRGPTESTLPIAQCQVIDPMGLPQSVVDPTGTFTDYFYGDFHNLDTVQHVRGETGIGNQTTFEYDLQGRLLVQNDPDAGEQIYTYTGFDEVFSHRAADEVKSFFGYDPAGRLIQRDDENLMTGEASRTTYEYGVSSIDNNVGRLVRATSPDGVVDEYEYYSDSNSDSRGLLSALTKFVPRTPGSTDTEQFRTGMVYDSLKRLETMSYPEAGGESFSVRFGRDDVGNVTSVYDGTDSSLVYWQATQAFQGQAVEEEVLGNGVSTTTFYQPTTGRVSGFVSSLEGSNELVQDLAYFYSPNGLLQSRWDRALSFDDETFSYDALDRLVPPGHFLFAKLDRV